MELLQPEDIEGLISMGAPGDEYDSEAQMITDRIEVAKALSPNGRISRQHVFGIVVNVWREMFGLSEDGLQLRSEAFQDIALRIVP
jgi:hypothetical protein